MILKTLINLAKWIDSKNLGSCAGSRLLREYNISKRKNDSKSINKFNEVEKIQKLGRFFD